MNDSVVGVGERREASRRHRRWLVIGSLTVVAAISGAFAGIVGGDRLFGAGKWPLSVSLVVCVAYLCAVAGGSILLSRRRDEIQVSVNHRAASVAAAVFIWGYPLWYILWASGVLPEPRHELVYILFWLTLAGASLGRTSR